MQSFIDLPYEASWASLKIEELPEDLEYCLQQAEKNLNLIEAVPEGSVSYENVAEALEDSSDLLDHAWSIVNHLSNVDDSETFRKVYNEVLPKVTDFYSGICLRPKLWTVVSKLTDHISGLDPLKRRHVEELIRDFEECGASLSDKDRKRIAEIDAELARITQKFSENVLDSTNDWELVIDDPKMVDPLPEVHRQIARENALSKGYGSEEEPKWRFTLHAPSVIPFLKYVEDPKLREQMWLANTRIATEGKWDNSTIICDVVKLRQEKAELLGNAQFADFVLARRMAQNGQNARDFVKLMREAVGSSAQKEVKELEDFRANALGLETSEQIEPWDVAYWSERMLQENYDFDEEKLRAYFPHEQVIAGLFNLSEKIFGLDIRERPTHVGIQEGVDSVEVWTEKVQFYEIYDSDSGEKIGAFYADWFPRESKRSGAWMDTLISGRFGDDGKPDELPMGIICGNMTPGSEGKPALLSHSEVETVFHEFGHLIHEICGEVPVKYLNGISVPWDFVEVPSQMMENWCWQRESLDLFAKHFETGDVIPEELFEKMNATRNFQKGLAILRQLSFGIMDLDLHIDFAGTDEITSEKLISFAEDSIADYRPNWKTHAPPLLHRFGHLFSSGVGYAAGYYSYQWSEVIEADAFGKFVEEGFLNAESGRAFRKEILAVGNSRSPMESYIAFRGRKPTLEAYLKRAEMTVTAAAKAEFGG